MLKEEYLDIYSTKVDYHIKVYHNINILVGDSATGKSQIVETFNKIRISGKEGTIKSSIPVEILNESNFQYIARLNNIEKTIFVVDEDTSFLDNNEFSEFIFRSGCFFIIICREENIIEESIDVMAVYKMVSTKVNFKTISSLEHFYKDEISDTYDGYPLYTEDIKSGRILCEMCNISVEKGLGGNGNIKVFVSKLKNSCISLFVDTVAFGQIMPFVVSAKKKGNKINLLDCKSTEFILLKNKRIDSQLTASDKVWDFKKYKSLEKLYTHLYKIAYKRLTGKDYKKNTIDKDFIDEAVIDEMKRIFKEQNKMVSKSLINLV